MAENNNPTAGQVVQLQPGLRRLLAPNPSPMTYRGTNTYLLGETQIAVIDPGPPQLAHLDAILGALTPDQVITHIVVTHGHLDHSGLAPALAQKTGAPILGFGTATDGRSSVMKELAAAGMQGGGEGIDRTYRPDVRLRDQQRIAGEGWMLEVLHTPGHLGNHICLAWQDYCFTGDHVMGWASSLVSPPDGDLTDFMASCLRLQERDWRAFFPGHGDRIEKPAERLAWLIEHRRQRERAILKAVQRGPATIAEIAKAVYVDVDAALRPAAERNVLAHIIDLIGKSEVNAIGQLEPTGRFQIAKTGRK